MTYFEDHLYLRELSTFMEPKSQYLFDYTFQSIDEEIAKYEQWQEFRVLPQPQCHTRPALILPFAVPTATHPIRRAIPTVLNGSRFVKFPK